MSPPLSKDEVARLAAKFCKPTTKPQVQPAVTPPTDSKSQSENASKEPARQDTRTTQSLIVNALLSHPCKTCDEVALLIGRHKTTTRDHLSRLKARGWVSCYTVHRGPYRHPTEVWHVMMGTK